MNASSIFQQRFDGHQFLRAQNMLSQAFSVKSYMSTSVYLETASFNRTAFSGQI